jgi:3-deoxy-manno-octulosonate cytidylyltransferase (CMP-KDO synthetase)
MAVLVVIPARYASSRYPGKPLVPLRGADGSVRTLIRRTWEAGMAVPGVARVVVATDDDRIRTHAEGFGAEVVMTSERHRNGTERCAEALALLGGGFDIVVNLQGDAPLTPPWFVTAVVEALAAAPGMGAATPVLRMEAWALAQLRADRREGRPGGTTAVFAADGRALYFSREVIPFTATDPAPGAPTPVFHHVGLYAYRPAALEAYAAWAPGPLEGQEGLEQLRFLERGVPVLCVEVAARGRRFWEVNHPADVPRIESILAAEGRP